MHRGTVPKRPPNTVRALIAAALAALVALGGSAPAASKAMSPEEAEQVIAKAMAEVPSIPGQALALIEFAWIKPGRDPVVAALAREKIIGFNTHALEPMRQAYYRLNPADQADFMDAYIRARKEATFGIPPDYAAGLVTTLWFGTREAKRVVLPELARNGIGEAVLPLIDSMIEDPALLPDGIETLGGIRDERARFYLEELLNTAKSPTREGAAAALGRIGGRALIPLKSALRSPDQAVRLAAMRSLLPAAGIEDITALYEYVTTHGADDPALAESVRRLAAHLEKTLEVQQAEEGLDPSRDF